MTTLRAQLPTAPYPGLRPFEPHEWSIFCGREALVFEVIERLGTINVAFVHGSSGCGKSSLVRAGVLPAIARDHALAERPYAHAIFRPSEGPLRGLARTLAQSLGAPEGEADAAGWWANELIFSRRIVEVVEERIVASGLDAFCLVVDQFEEIFPWIRERGRSDVEVLVALLCEAAKDKEGRRFFALVTMRSDYLGQCAQFPDLSVVINRGQYFLPNLDDDGLYRAITEPAGLFGGSVTPALADRLRFSAGNRQDQLPVLQHVLMRMAESVRHAGGQWVLDLPYLVQAEGETGALSEHAEEVYGALVEADGEAAADAMEWIFRALVDVDVGGRGIRRPCSFAHLVKVSGARADLVGRIVTRYASPGCNFLVVSGDPDTPDDCRVDMGHEALMRSWTRMAGTGTNPGWLQREFQDGLLWRALAVTARNEDAVLDAATTEEREPWFKRFAECPERARRYLLAPVGKANMEEEPEWKAVARLMAASRREVDATRERELAESRKAEEEFRKEQQRMLADARRAEAEFRREQKSKRRIVLLSVIAFAATLLAGYAYYKVIDSERRLAETEKRRIQALAAAEETKSRPAIDFFSTAVEQEVAQHSVDRGDPQETVSDSFALDVYGMEQAGPQSSSQPAGFVWIGHDGTSNLRSDAGTVRPQDVVKGRRYTLRHNLVLRDGLPREGNKSAPPISIIPKNSEVFALETPTPVLSAGSRQPQYWLMVRAVRSEAKTEHRVFVHYARGSPIEVKMLMDAIRERGFDVPDADQEDSATGLHEVRYCHEQDQQVAWQLSQKLATIKRGTDFELKRIGNRRACASTLPGTLEVWTETP
jgi:hypothetical protein